MSVRFWILALGLAAGLVHAAPTGERPYAVQQRFVVGGAGGWDYLTVDAQTHHLFIARSDRVLVVNVRDGSLVANIPDTPGVHGIAMHPLSFRVSPATGGRATDYRNASRAACAPVAARHALT